MAIYKLFPTKDATIYSRYPNKNTGLDEILDVSIEDAQDSGNTQSNRFLVQFSQTEITDILTNKVSSSLWSASFNAYLAYGDGLNIDTTLEFYPISQSWEMGTGKYSYSPEYTNGVSWVYRGAANTTAWATSSFSSLVTASYSSSKGGGTWYTGSSNTGIVPDVTASQTFTYFDDFDINVDVTNIVKAWTSSLIANNGIIVKQATEFIDSLEYNNTLRYFSRDTHTIYPPSLDIKWRDYTWNTGSSTFTILNTLPAFIDIAENLGIFYPDSVNKFRVNARPEYPVDTVGSFVSWDSSGGTARGRIEHVMREGVLGIPGTDFSITAEDDDPAVLIRIYEEFRDGWRATETLVGHKASTLTAIEPLPEASPEDASRKISLRLAQAIVNNTN